MQSQPRLAPEQAFHHRDVTARKDLCTQEQVPPLYLFTGNLLLRVDAGRRGWATHAHFSFQSQQSNLYFPCPRQRMIEGQGGARDASARSILPMQEIIMEEEKAFPACPSTLLFLPQEKIL